MSTMTRLLAVIALVLTTLGAFPKLALAASPGNDLFSGATPVSIGFSEVLDTSEATTDGDDAQLNESCGAPATDASVWYALEGSDTGIVVDVSQSNYPAGVLVGVGTQGSLSIVSCGPGATDFYAAAGSTYYILAIDDQSDGSGNGGQLSITIAEIIYPNIEISVDPEGYVDGRTGIATISGTYSCTDADFIDVFIDAQQTAGKRFSILGSGLFTDFGTCDGTLRTWSATIYPQNGKFAGGKAMSLAFAFSCGQFTCSESYAEQQVILKGKRK